MKFKSRKKMEKKRDKKLDEMMKQIDLLHYSIGKIDDEVVEASLLVTPTTKEEWVELGDELKKFDELKKVLLGEKITLGDLQNLVDKYAARRSVKSTELELASDRSALYCYEKALEIDNEFDWAWFKIAVLYNDAALLPELPECYIELDQNITGELLVSVQNKLYQKALSYLHKALLIDKDYPLYLALEGDIYYLLNELEKSKACFVASIKNYNKNYKDENDYGNFFGDIDPIYSLASIYYESSRPRKALYYFRESVKHQLDNTKSLIKIVEILEELNKYTEALEYCEYAINNLAGSDDEESIGTFLFKKSMINNTIKQYSAAITGFRQVLKDEKSDYFLKALQGIAESYFNLNNFESAMKACKQYNEKRDKQDIDSHKWLALMVLKIGKASNELVYLKNALGLYRKLTTVLSNDTDAWIGVADTLQALGRQQEALECYDKIIKNNPNNTTVWQHRGEYYLGKRQYKHAAKCFNAVLEKDANNLAALTCIIDCYKMVKDYEQALKFCARANKLSKKDTKLIFTMGGCLFELGRLNKALKCFDKVLVTNKQHMMAWYYKAKTLESMAGSTRYPQDKCMSYLTQSIACYEQALELDANQSACIPRIAANYMKLSQFEQAAEYFQRHLSLKPNVVSSMIGRATALFCVNPWDKQISKLTAKVLSNNRNNLYALSIQALMLCHRNQHEKAVVQLTYLDENASKLMTTSELPLLFLYQGLMFLSLNEYKDAIICFGQSLGHNKKYAIAKYYLEQAESTQKALKDEKRQIKQARKQQAENEQEESEQSTSSEFDFDAELSKLLEVPEIPEDLMADDSSDTSEASSEYSSSSDTSNMQSTSTSNSRYAPIAASKQNPEIIKELQAKKAAGMPAVSRRRPSRHTQRPAILKTPQIPKLTPQQLQLPKQAPHGPSSPNISPLSARRQDISQVIAQLKSEFPIAFASQCVSIRLEAKLILMSSKNTELLEGMTAVLGYLTLTDDSDMTNSCLLTWTINSSYVARQLFHALGDAGMRKIENTSSKPIKGGSQQLSDGHSRPRAGSALLKHVQSAPNAARNIPKLNTPTRRSSGSHIIPRPVARRQQRSSGSQLTPPARRLNRTSAEGRIQSTNSERGGALAAAANSATSSPIRDPELIARMEALEGKVSLNAQSIIALKDDVTTVKAQQHQYDKNTTEALTQALSTHKQKTEAHVRETYAQLMQNCSRDQSQLKSVIQGIVDEVLDPRFEGDMQSIMHDQAYQNKVMSLVQEQIDSINTRQQSIALLTRTLESKQIDLTNKTDPLVKKHQIKQALLTEQNQLLTASAPIQRFYKTIEQGLGARLFSAMILSSQMIERTVTTTEKLADAGATVASNLCSLIPVVGEVAGNVLSFGINKVANLYVEKRLENQQQAVMDGMLSPKDGMKIAEMIARKVTQNYRKHIAPLSEDESKDTAMRAVDIIYESFTRGELKQLKGVEQKIQHLLKRIDTVAGMTNGLILKKGGLFKKAAKPEPSPSQHRAIMETRERQDKQNTKIELIQRQHQMELAKVRRQMDDMQRLLNAKSEQSSTHPPSPPIPVARRTPARSAATRVVSPRPSRGRSPSRLTAPARGVTSPGIFKSPGRSPRTRRDMPQPPARSPRKGSPQSAARRVVQRGPVPPTPPRRTGQQPPTPARRWR